MSIQQPLAPPEKLYNRIVSSIRRLSIIMYVLMVTFSISAVLLIGFNTQVILRSEAVVSFDERITNELSRVLEDINSISDSPSARDYNALIREQRLNPTGANARAFRDSQITLLRSMNTLIERNPNLYLSVAFLPREGFVWGEAVNSQDGQIILQTEERRSLRGELEEAYTAMVASRRDRLTFSEIRTDPDGGRYISIYAPVVDTVAPQLRGIIQFNIRLEPLIQSIYLLDLDSPFRLAQRRMYIVTTQGEIIASTAPNPGDSALPEQILRQPVDSSTALIDGRLMAISGITLYEGADMPWRLVVEDNLFASLSRPFAISILAIIIGGLMWYTVYVRLSKAVAEWIAPVSIATDMAQKLVDGQLITTSASVLQGASPPPTGGDDEIGQVVQSMNTAAQRIVSLARAAEVSSERRTRDIELASRIGQQIATYGDIDQLLYRSIDLITRELGFYHAQVFLVDDARINAVLVYSHGEAGRQLLAMNHKIAVGSSTVIGTVTSAGKPVVVNDTQASNSPHGFNAILAETRAEMGLPLTVGGTVIGALDVQSTRPDAFSDDDIPVFRLIADQLAVAIDKARRIAQAEKRYTEASALSRSAVETDWRELEKEIVTGYRYNLLDVQPLDEGIEDDDAHSVPISVRGADVGVLSATPGAGYDLSQGDRMIMRAVSDRVALAIENARLFREQQNNLSETSTLYQLSRFLTESNTLEDVLQAIIISTMQDAGGGQVMTFDAYITELKSMLVRADLPMSDRKDESLEDLTNQRLLLSDYPFFSTLSPTTPTLITDVASDPRLDDSTRTFLTNLSAGAAVIIPLTMRGEWLGFVMMEFEEPRQFTQREERLFVALIDQAGIAIDNRLLFEQTETTLLRSEDMYAASRVINSTQSFVDLVRAAVTVNRNYDLDFSLALLEGEEDESGWPTVCRVVAESHRGIVEETEILYPIRVSSRSPMRRREPEQILNGGEPGVSTHIPWLTHNGELPFVAMYPLFSVSQPTAILFLTSTKPYTIDAEDNDMYRSLTGQMSTQIENRRLLERTEATLEETLRLYRASRAISGARDIHMIATQAVDYLAQPLRDKSRNDPQTLHVALLLEPFNTKSGQKYLESEQYWTTDPGGNSALVEGTRIQAGTDIINSLMPASENSVILTDVSDITEPELAPLIAPMRYNNARDALIVPVRTREVSFGLFVLTSSKARFFNEELARYVEGVAGQVSVAIENRRLFLQVQNDQRRLQQVLSTLPSAVLVFDPRTLKPGTSNAQALEILGEFIRDALPFSAENYRLYRTAEEGMLYPDEDLPVLRVLETNLPANADDITVELSDGRKIDLLVNAAPINDDDGKIVEIVVTFTDITNLRSLEAVLQQTLRQTLATNDTLRLTTQAQEVEDVLDVLDVQLTMLKPSDAYILLADRRTGDLHIERMLVGGLKDPSLLGDLLLSDRELSVPDTQRHNLTPEIKSQLASHGFRSVMSAPLVTATSAGKPLGWLVITHENPDAFNAEHESTLRQLGDIGATALDNRLLILSTRSALEETDKLYRITSAVNRSRGTDQLLDALENALKSLQPDGYRVFFSGDRMMGLMASSIMERGEGFELVRATLIRYGISGDSLFIDDLDAFEPQTQMETEFKIAAGDWRAIAVLNLRVKGMPYGRVVLAYQQARTFVEEERRFLQALTDSASVVLDNFALVEETQANLEEATVLYQSIRALSEATQEEDILSVVVNQLAPADTDQVFIALLRNGGWDDPHAVIEIVASWNIDSAMELTGVLLSPDQLPVWKYMASRNLWHSTDIYADERLEELDRVSFESLDVRSVAIMPLRVPNRMIGAIWASSREPHNHTEGELRVYQSFGEQASLSLEASYLLQQTERRARQLETSAQVSSSTGTLLDLQELLPQLVNLIRDSFNYDHVQIFLMDEKNEYAELRASTGEAGKRLLGIKHRLQRGSASVIGQVTETRKPTIALDTADADVVHKPNPYLPQTRSEMALPLIIKGEVIGALDVQSNMPNAFGNDDVNALTTLAAQISIAIDNANLYQQAQEQASRMSLLFSITTSAAFAPTLTELLNTVASQLHSSYNALSVGLYLKRDFIDRDEQQFSRLIPVAVVGEGDKESAPSPRMDDENSLIAYASRQMQSLIVDEVMKEDRYQPFSEGANSAVIAPLMYNNVALGLIVMENARSRAYTYQEMQLLMTLSNTLSSIVQSTLLLEQLQDANDELRELDRIKNDFLANMSHELRTPLNSIIGFSRVMLKGIDGPLTEMQEQDLTTIYNSGNHLLALINDILDQAKIAAGKMDIKASFFDMKGVVDVVKSMGIGYMKDKPLKLYVDVASGLPKVFADEIRIRQVLINLISNAIKFTQQGSVSLRVYPVTDNNNVPFVRVDVEDTGIGIAEQDLHLLFEAFRQVDSSLTRMEGGTGLGLPIAKALIEMQGGALLVQSEVNVGSTFSVLIPTVEPETTETEEDGDDESQEVKAAPPTFPERNGGKQYATQETRTVPRMDMPPRMMQKRLVLLIEDDPNMVDQFRRALQREGFEVMTASIVLEAEAMASGLHPTLVVMDVNFANGAGWNILKNLKDRDDTFDIPIIVVSLSEETERAYQLGAHTFISRPFVPEDLTTAALEAEKESNTERILIIDDQPDDIRLLTHLLDEHGHYRVFFANNGQEGIALVARRRPDLVILDLRMPDMDGFAVLNELRNNPETANIPVMVVTGDITLNADEQEQLTNVRVLQKTDISQEEFNDFITRVQDHLSGKE